MAYEGRVSRYDADEARRCALGMTKLLTKTLDALPLNDSKRKVTLLEQLRRLVARGETPQTLIAFYGSTGAGKSSLINALLEDTIMFTSGMQACTSVVTEISFKPGDGLEAHIEFFTAREWEDEVQMLLDDIHDPESQETTEEVEAARSKVKAVYPSISAEELSRTTAAQLIARDSVAKLLLDKVANIQAENSAELGRELLRYIDFRGRLFTRAEDPGTLPAAVAPTYWPLVKSIRIQVNSDLLACGAVLVDLPGIGDSNAARNKIAQGYLRRADRIFIVAPIARVVSERSTNVLCSEALRSQLEMDGKYSPGAVTFVATKCDQVMYTETIRELPGLRLENEPNVRGLQRRLEQAGEDARSLNTNLKRLNERRQDLELQVRRVQDGYDDMSRQHGSLHNSVPAHLQAGSSRMRPGDTVQATKRTRDYEELSGHPCKKRKILNPPIPSPYCLPKFHDEVPAAQHVEVASLEKQLTAATYEITSIRDQIDVVARRKQGIVKELKVICAKKRSEFSQATLKALFRASLDDTLADRYDGDLPVFTVSANDYLRLELQNGPAPAMEDGEAACFSDTEDTGIPALQRWIQDVTLSAREAAAEKLLLQLRDLTYTVEKWIDGIPGVSPADRDALRRRWQSESLSRAPIQPAFFDVQPNATFRRLSSGKITLRPAQNAKALRSERDARYAARPNAIVPRLFRDLDPIVDTLVNDLGELFSTGLAAKCRDSAGAAAKDLLKASENFGKVGGSMMHWAKYRATLRRRGDYLENLNTALAAPFIRRIAHAWSEVFKTQLLTTLESRADRKISHLLAEITSGVPPYMRARAEEALLTIPQKARSILQDVQTDVRRVLNDSQGKIGRLLGPLVQEHLVEGYELAYAETGKGMYQRQRSVFNTYLESKKYTLFDDAADVLIAGLADTAQAVGKVLDLCLEDVAKKIEADVSVLWEVCPLEGEEHMNARLLTKDALANVMTEINDLLDAKTVRDRDRDGLIASMSLRGPARGLSEMRLDGATSSTSAAR